MKKKSEYVIELFADNDYKPRFRLVHANGNILMSSEAYERPATRTRIANRIAGDHGWKVVNLND